jgi:hypothetical protein
MYSLEIMKLSLGSDFIKLSNTPSRQKKTKKNTTKKNTTKKNTTTKTLYKNKYKTSVKLNSNNSKKSKSVNKEVDFYSKVKKLIQDENIYNIIYGFGNTITSYLIRYFDKETKVILNQGFKNFKLCEKFKVNINNVLKNKLDYIHDLLITARNNYLIEIWKTPSRFGREFFIVDKAIIQ